MGLIASIARLFGHLVGGHRERDAALPSHTVNPSATPTEGVSANSGTTIGQNPAETVGSNAGVTVGSSPTEGAGSQPGVTVGGAPNENVGGNTTTIVGRGSGETVGSHETVSINQTLPVNVSANVGVSIRHESPVDTSTGVGVGRGPVEGADTSHGVGVGRGSHDTDASSAGVGVGRGPADATGPSTGVGVGRGKSSPSGGSRHWFVGALAAMIVIGIFVGVAFTRPRERILSSTLRSATAAITLPASTEPAIMPTSVVTAPAVASATPSPISTHVPIPRATSTPQLAPSLSVSPTGEQDITCGAEPFTYPAVTVRNAGGGTLGWTVTVTNPHVTVAPESGSLSAGQSRSLSITQGTGGMGTNLTVIGNGMSAVISFVCVAG
jgi:hypothetical protein